MNTTPQFKLVIVSNDPTGVYPTKWEMVWVGGTEEKVVAEARYPRTLGNDVRWEE